MKQKSLESAISSAAPALVLPSQLAADAAQAVREMLAEAAAANTTRSYATALRYWAGWYRVRFGGDFTLPLSEAAVIQFVVDHVARKSKDGGLTWELPPEHDKALVESGLKAKFGPWKLASVVHRVAVLSTAHRLKRLDNPCELPAVRTVLSRARRASVKRGERPTKKTAITKPELEAMLATCDDSLEGLRDRALLCFGFSSGGRRRSEIAAADMRDLKRIGPSAYIYTRHSPLGFRKSHKFTPQGRSELALLQTFESNLAGSVIDRWFGRSHSILAVNKVALLPSESSPGEVPGPGQPMSLTSASKPDRPLPDSQPFFPRPATRGNLSDTGNQ